MTGINRRRFLMISGAALAVSGGAMASPVATWQGVALGAQAQMQIIGLGQAEAGRLFARVEAEIDRLEDMFSLYRPQSLLNRLNDTGVLLSPPPEFLELLSLVTSVNAATNGAFDPTIQPLWRAYAQGAGEERLSQLRDLVGWDGVSFGTHGIYLAKKGMALSLNGVAQGYVSDRVARLLRNEGLGNLVVNLGEINAFGPGPEGAGWSVGIAAPGLVAPVSSLQLSNRSLATSAPGASTIGPGGPGHIIDPRNGLPSGLWSVVSVSANSAALADAMSTAFCIMERSDIDGALQVFTGSKIEYLV